MGSRRQLRKQTASSERPGLIIAMEIAQRRQAIEPREISQVTDTHLRISWADEKVCDYDAARLRRACPCAQCVNEWTGERTLKAEAISDEVEIKDVSIVGRYALNFRWSDGHETGIYSFQYLRDLCDSSTEPLALASA